MLEFTPFLAACYNRVRWAVALCGVCVLPLAAQTDSTTADDLLEMLPTSQQPAPVRYTFKAQRVVNQHTVEMLGPHMLDFRIAHRFGYANNGASDFFGLDQATVRLGLEYGATPWLTVGIGRTSLAKLVDGFAKVRLLQQKRGGGSPLSVVVVGNTGITTQKWSDALEDVTNTSHRLLYTTQVLLARKFGERFSLQLAPTWVHYNLTPVPTFENDLLALGVAARFKVTKRLALTGEYTAVQPDTRPEGYFNSVSLGLDLETGGHVFSLFFTNSLGMADAQFLGQTTGDIANGDIAFGFNIVRSFALGGNRESAPEW